MEAVGEAYVRENGPYNASFSCFERAVERNCLS